MSKTSILLAVMPKKAVLFSTLLCCIIQVAHIPRVWSFEEGLDEGLNEDINVVMEKRLVDGKKEGRLVSFNESLDEGLEVESEDITTVLVEIEIQDLLNAIAGGDANNTATEVKKHCDNEVRVIASLVPDGNNALNATWTTTDPCDDVVQYKVFFIQHPGSMIVNGTTNYTTMTFKGLEGCLLHSLEVFALDSDSQILGRGGHDMAYTEIFSPKVVNLTLNATLKQITAKWSQKDPRCFPDLTYRFTAAGVNEIVSQNDKVISGLACNTSYYVTVWPVGVDGANYGIQANATMKTQAENIALRVKLTARASRSLVVVWDPVVSSCQNITGYEVSYSGGPEMVGANITITNKTYFHILSLAPAVFVHVLVQPVNSKGLAFGVGGTAREKTLASISSGRCSFPSFEIYLFQKREVSCAVVVLLARKTLAEANAVCSSYPFVDRISGSVYVANPSYTKFENIQYTIKSYGYTEKLMMQAFFSKNWTWGIPGNPASHLPVDPALLIGVPAGGSGSNDYKFLYLDPAKDFGLRAAKDVNAFEGILCVIKKRIP